MLKSVTSFLGRMNAYLCGYPKAICIILLTAFLIRSFIVDPRYVPSGSMLPTIYRGDSVIVTKFAYGYTGYSSIINMPFLYGFNMTYDTPTHGDICVFRPPQKAVETKPAEEKSMDFVKRVVGMPGDRIAVENGQVILNGKPIPREFLGYFRDHEYQKRYRAYRETLPSGYQYTVLDYSAHHYGDYMEEVTVPQGHYFMMGDNRDDSHDSRSGWFVPQENLVGRVDVHFVSRDPKIGWLDFPEILSSFRIGRSVRMVDFDVPAYELSE